MGELSAIKLWNMKTTSHLHWITTLFLEKEFVEFQIPMKSNSTLIFHNNTALMEDTRDIKV